MPASPQTRDRQDRGALIERGDLVARSYWFAACLLVIVLLTGDQLGNSTTTFAATLLFIFGGLPHGAYDIALLKRAVVLDRHALRAIVAGYAATAVLMALLWMTLPLTALIVFMVVAAIHFGEDWQMLDEPLLRFAAGAAVVAAATIGHRADVTALFVEMSDERASVIAQVIVAAAPVILLVTAVGIGVAWRDGSRSWAVAMTSCLILLVLLPPVIGFALFFVFLHSPRHLALTRATLWDFTLPRWIATGAMLSAAAMAGWWALHAAGSLVGGTMTAQAFQLLASVAVPHLILSDWIENRLTRSALAIPLKSKLETRKS